MRGAFRLKKLLLIFGTRPEAIKMCPLARELKTRPGFSVRVCVTGQHRDMLDEALAAFSLRPDADLKLMRERQTLAGLSAALLEALPPLLEKEKPALVLVHGDTTTAFAAALCCFYLKIPIAHVEAGLRTGRLDAPFPEEFNRQAVGLLSDWHFAPTERARQNLLREGKDARRVFVTGNTVVDALRLTVRADFSHPVLDWAEGRDFALLTAHRRESLDGRLETMLQAIRAELEAHPALRVVYPVHRNPAVRAAAQRALGGCAQILLTEPLGVTDFHNLLSRCRFVLTDSGGIQEEASALGVPTLVLRDATERPEGVEAGTLRLAGTEVSSIRRALRELLDEGDGARSAGNNPYGDGSASRKIADILETVTA